MVKLQAYPVVLLACAVLLIACGRDEPSPTKSGSSSTPSEGTGIPTDPVLRDIYDQAAAILGDPNLALSDRRNRLRVLRRSVDDDLFFSIVQEVPVNDPNTGTTVGFAEYMEDLAATYVANPEAPISFDPVGAAMRIYFSPTEETIREMTGIGVGHARVLESRSRYLAVLAGESSTQPAQDQAPAFVKRDTKLMAAYNRAKTVMTDGSNTDDSRRRELRMLQDEVGQETLTLVLRYVPVVDAETGKVETFDNYMRDLASSYGSGGDAPIDRDPVGATMRIFFDPSPETIQAMTGIGLSGSEQRDASRRYERERADFSSVAREIVSESVSQFADTWKELKSEGGGGGGISSWFGDN